MPVLENAGTGNWRYWKMPVLENDSTGNCRYWKMPVLENAGSGKCQYWKMPVLKMPVLENTGTGKCRYWKMQVLEIGGTGKCRYWKMPVPECCHSMFWLAVNWCIMEISYKNSCSEKISLCWKWTERNLKSGGRLKGTLSRRPGISRLRVSKITIGLLQFSKG